MDKETLKTQIEELIQLEKEEEKYKNIFANFKKKKEALNENIIQFITANNIAEKDIIFGDKKIKYTSNKVQDGITKKLIFDRLNIFLKNEEHAKNATSFIYSDRNSSQKFSLKISNIKSNK